MSASIANDGQTTITANLPMSNFRHTGVGNAAARNDYASAGQIQDGSLIWCGTATGTANALVLTATPVITAVTAGMRLVFKSSASPNTSTTTVTIGSASSIAVQVNGAACAGGEILASKWYEIIVDAGLTTCQLNKIGRVTVAELDATLASIAALGTAADKVAYTTGVDTWAETPLTAGGRSLVNSAGTADTFPYFSASNTVTLAAITAAARSLIAAADASAMRALLGIPLSGSVVKKDGTLVSALATGSTVLPADNTVPQNTEGDQYMSFAFTPTNASNTLYIYVLIHVSSSISDYLTAALFQNATAGALTSCEYYPTSGNRPTPMMFIYKLTAGTTSATTFKVRAGPGSAGTVTFNGNASGALYGGVLTSAIFVEEVAA